MTDIMLRMLDVIKNYRSKLLSGALINNDHPAHKVCVRFNAGAHNKCAQTFVCFWFCFENVKKHPIRFSNKRFKSIFRPAHLLDWHCAIFNYMGANGFAIPAATYTDHRVCTMCTKCVNVNFFYRSSVSASVCCVCGQLSLWHILKLTVAHSHSSSSSVSLSVCHTPTKLPIQFI